ncbi:TrkH family potassium uptake protein [Caviibacter abscessus]|uniref:TrkH family potassium uptake protein n=1 Tax=Caviibacter abscessus TaxID=1766719 RepID=UPI0008356DB2|nr:potassium transporter TrkG [Caviibacter abscessus]
MKKTFKLTPYTQILLSFALIILIGAFILSLPISSADNMSKSFIESLFTSTSAVCVTGLTVSDISVSYSVFGKIVIIILVQLGGLGILTFSSMIILLLSRKMGYYTKKIVSEDLNYNIITEIPSYLKRVSLVVFSIEFVGAILLFTQYIRSYDLKKAIAYSIFHSISAFCNAGFSLYSNSLESYYANTSINMIIIYLIVLGGLGFAAILDLYNASIGIRRKLSLSTRLAIMISVSLIILGTVITFIIEYSNPQTIGNLTLPEKFIVSLFQSVTTRTAGFQTINLAYLKTPTILLYMFLMFVGASPGSTGGGIKTTTLGIMIFGIVTAVTGKENIEYEKRKLSWTLFNKATAILIVSILYIFIAIFLLSVFDSDKTFLSLMFELVSAFGTVGLSMGITGQLSIYSKLIIILTMFIGRIGPLTVLLAISKKKLKTGKYKYPEETVLIG